MDETVLQVKNLCFDAKDKTILKDVSFSIEQGEKAALIGSNGAGKTTLLYLLLDYIKPSGGGIEFYGKSFPIGKLFQKIGFVTIRSPLSPNLTVKENIKFHCALADVNYKSVAPRLIDLFDIESILNRYALKLSTGETKKVSLLIALLNRPEILFLDEPFANIDPTQADRIQYILNQEVKTIFYITHNWDGVIKYASHIIPLHKGIILSQKSSLQDFMNIIAEPKKIIVDKTSIPQHILNENISYQQDDRISLFPKDLTSCLQQISKMGHNFSIQNKEVLDIYNYLVANQ